MESATVIKHAGLDSFPMFLQWIIKIGTVLLGGLAIFLGILTAISIDVRCIFAGVLLIVGGFIIVAFEAPILCSFVKCIEPVSNFSKNRAPWQKFLFYVVPPPIIIILCPSVTPIFGALCMLIVAMLYLFFVVLRSRGQY